MHGFVNKMQCLCKMRAEFSKIQLSFLFSMLRLQLHPGSKKQGGV